MAEDTRTEQADPSTELRGAQPPFMGIGFLLSTTGFAVARRFAKTLEQFDLEPRQFALLRAIAFSEGLAQNQLGARLQIPASRMVAVVDDLEERDLVERRQNPDDRRARALYLTPAGQELFERAFAAAAQLEQTVIANLSNSEREQLVGLLRRVGDELGVVPGAAHSALREGWPR